MKHTLASSEYNVRRAQCEAGVAVILKHVGGIESLRDVTMDMLNTYKDEMDPIVYRRCSYVINENNRLLEACAALEKGDYVTFGQKMNGSHEGLSKWYEVSCEELDFLAEIGHRTDGVLGARMMGGGFGGCTINLVKDEALCEQLRGRNQRQVPTQVRQGSSDHRGQHLARGSPYRIVPDRNTNIHKKEREERMICSSLSL